MPTTIAPADEACEALVARINAGGAAYTLPTAATYSYQEVEGLEQITNLRVDVVPMSETVLDERLDGTNPSSHVITVVMRKQVADATPTTVKPLTLIRRQLFEWLDNWDSSDRRVRVIQADMDDSEKLIKTGLNNLLLFSTFITLKVEVTA